MNLRVFTTILFSICLLAGCAAPPLKYYQLPDSQYQLPEQAEINAIIQVKLNDHLKHTNGLIYQTTPTELNIATQHQWSESLTTAIAKSLANKLNRQSSKHRYTIHQNVPNLPILTVYIEAFQGQFNGHTHISGYAIWSDRKYTGKNFDVESIQKGNGYAAMVDSLNTGLQEIAKIIEH